MCPLIWLIGFSVKTISAILSGTVFCFITLYSVYEKKFYQIPELVSNKHAAFCLQFILCFNTCFKNIDLTHFNTADHNLTEGKTQIEPERARGLKRENRWEGVIEKKQGKRFLLHIFNEKPNQEATAQVQLGTHVY